MTPERWRLVTGIFHAALAREGEAREAYVADACRDDPTLRADVDQLLAGHQDAGAFGERPVNPLSAFARRRHIDELVEAAALVPGAQLGPYEILELVGAGGMGEVYRARDTKLGRTVAIKVLPASLASDPDRIGRFEREARLLAALNHPHIAAIYGVEDAPDVHGLVLEFVEGPTLADRLAAGRLPLGETLALARQIAEALAAAHAKGIIHRDLKPANIKVTADGVVKILDFGLAKVWTAEAGAETQESTVTGVATREGAFLGTPRYMSPEQVRAGPVDTRTDAWAFGCVLFEMLAGRPAFGGETVSDTLARVLEREPHWRALPSSTPARIRDLVRRCLQKAADERLGDLGEARRHIDACLASPFRPLGAAARSVWFGLSRPAVRWTLAAASVAAVAVLGYRLQDRPTPLPRLDDPIQVTNVLGVEDYPTWSPDGQTLAYESVQRDNWDIWVSQVGGAAAVDRTADSPGDDRYPSWSPDGHQIAFWSTRDGGSGYYVMPAVGGAARKLVATPFEAALHSSPAAWSPDSTRIAVAHYEPVGTHFAVSLEIVSVATGASRPLAIPGTQEGRLDLSWSHDAQYIAYLDIAQQPAETSQLMVLRLADGESIPVTDATLNVRSPQWATDDRALFFVANQESSWDLWRQNLDTAKHPRGPKERVTAGVDILHGTLSAGGTRFAYAKGRWVSNIWRVPILPDREATWADAQQLTFDQAFAEFVDVSRDGQWLAYSSDRMGNQDLWKQRIDGGAPIRLTSDRALEWGPSWSRDGNELSFYSNRTGNREIWIMSADGGPGRQLTSTKTSLNAVPAWSPTGDEIAYRSERAGSSDIFVTSVDRRDTRRLTDSPAAEYGGSWSPDGQWLALTSNPRGPRRLYRVRSDGTSPMEPLTEHEALGPPCWSRDGKQIFYVNRTGRHGGNLWALSPETKKERQITDFTGRPGEIGLQPPSTDGTYIYFTWREDLGDIWAMSIR